MLELICKNDDNIINYLTSFEGLNYNKIQALLRKKDIKVNDKRINKDCKIVVGDKILLYAKSNYFYNIKTIFEDENIIVVDKPKKLEVISVDRNISLLNLINPSFFVVHRIDFNTEGLVILAKNEKSKLALDEAFKNGQVNKSYISICKNRPQKEEIIFKDYLIKQNNIVKIVSNKTEEAKTIITQIKVLKYNKNYSLINVNLLTGRTHQIRAHLAYHNLFVLGDDKYGDFKENKKLNLKSQILKCYKIKFNFSENSKLTYLNNLSFLTDTTGIENYFESL